MRSSVAFGAVIVGILVAMPAAVSAQTMQLRLGAQLGVNFAQSPYDLPGLDEAIAEDAHRAGLSGGLTMTLVLPGQTLLSHELGLIVQGRGGTTKFSFDWLDGGQEPPYEYEWRLTYLTVPLLLKATHKVGAVRPYVKVGAEASLLLSASLVERYRDEDGSESYEIDHEIMDWLGSGDIGLVFGAGTEMPIGAAAGFVEVSYAHGLTDILEREDLFSSDAQLRNRVIGLTAGIRL